MNGKDYFLKSKNIHCVKEDEFVSEFHINLQTGYGTMKFYHILPGIELIYNNFKAQDCMELQDTFNEEKRTIVINHCNKGRFECNINGNSYFLSEGDIIATKDIDEDSYMVSEFTLGFYEGFELRLDVENCQKSLDATMGEGFMNISDLTRKLSENDNIFLIRSNDEIDHVISELYNVSEEIQEAYYKLKVFELMLFLKICDADSLIDHMPSLSNKLINKVKEIRKFMIEHINEDISLDYLEKEFSISKSSIKTYFKSIYGKSLYAWRREYRLHLASEYLLSSKLNIGEIAKKIGYSNSSKFSSAFKDYYGLTPSEYRKSRFKK